MKKPIVKITCMPAIDGRAAGKIPEYAFSTDSGCDLYSNEYRILAPGNIVLVHTGVKIALPDGYEAQVRSKSGLASMGVFVMNSPGTVDESYRGEILVILYNCGSDDFLIIPGKKIAQLVVAPYVQAEFEEIVSFEALTTERGECGFGSTGA